MKGIIICSIPEKRYHKVRRFLDDFMLTNAKYYKVEFAEGEYQSAYGGYKSLSASVKRGCYPIEVSLRNGEVYLTRTDM